MGGESYNVTINNASGVESHGGEKENEDYNGTEVITSGGSEDSFDLEFGVSYACSIQLIDQVIVTGGRRNYNNHFILEFELSTEIIIHGDSSWTLLPLASNLPSYKAGSASVSLDNKIFVTGG